MLRAALDFPTRGDRGARSVLVGGVLVLARWVLAAAAAGLAALAAPVPGEGGAAGVEAGAGASAGVAPGAAAAGLAVVAVPLVAVELALRGYRVRALRASISGPAAVAPGFGNVVALARQGAMALGLTACYALPGAALLSAAALGRTGRFGAQLGTGLARNATGLALLFGLFALLAAAYLLPAAVTSAAHDRSWRGGFRRRVPAGALSEDYAVGWLAAGVLTLVVSPVALGIAGLAIVPLLFAPLGSFFMAVSTRYLFGASFGRATGLDAP